MSSPKKKILIIHSNMEIGGAEISLIGLLQSLDYDKYDVDLLLYERKGDFLEYIPPQVNILDSSYGYENLVLPIKDVLLKNHSIPITLARLLAKFKAKGFSDPVYITKQYASKYSLPFLKKIQGIYDMAISFIDPHFVLSKVNAKVKLGWLHTDFSRIEIDKKVDERMWNICDYIVSVSETCKAEFDKKHPNLKHKSIVIENILSKDFILRRSEEFDVNSEMDSTTIKLLSIGRFSEQKNFDNIPYICKKIIDAGLNVKWYLIGYGGDEPLIRNNIEKAKMQDNVIIMGKRTNPYPYIKACDYYIQPSRYEGKCVAVREAQILCKPVIITSYKTAASQIDNNITGLIVPLSNEECGKAIITILKNNQIKEKLIKYCRSHDFTNSNETIKLYKIILSTKGNE